MKENIKEDFYFIMMLISACITGHICIKQLGVANAFFGMLVCVVCCIGLWNCVREDSKK